MTINCTGKLVDLSTPKIMGILNVTPDSFYDGGVHNSEKKILDHVEKMLNDGAIFIDIGAYSSRPNAINIDEDEELKAVLDWLASDFFSPKEGSILSDLPNSLLQWGDPFFVMADYRAYIDAQDLAGKTYQNPSKWASMAIRNIAGSGKFSSDRTIGEYASDVWKLSPVSVPVSE